MEQKPFATAGFEVSIQTASLIKLVVGLIIVLIAGALSFHLVKKI